MSASESFISVPERLGILDAAIQEFIYQALCHLHVSIPCIVKSFDPVKQTITAQPVTLEKMNVTQNGVPVATDVALPLLLDVPICLPRGGAFVLTLPIQIGDECHVVFSDIDFNTWWANGGANNTWERKRRHAFSNGIAHFGPWSQPNVVSSYSTTNAELRTLDGTVKIALKSNELDVTAPKVVITGSTEVDINSSSNLKIDGHVYLNHTHSDPQGGVTGPVIP
jgi:hypothetical protein